MGNSYYFFERMRDIIPLSTIPFGDGCHRVSCSSTMCSTVLCLIELKMLSEKKYSASLYKPHIFPCFPNQEDIYECL